MLSPPEIERYARHLILPEIGGAGQQKLKKSRVLIIGLGGLGTPSALYLAAAGVGHLTLLDDDVVSLSNLQRQVLYQSAEVGEAKVLAAKRHLLALNPHIEITAAQEAFQADHAAAQLKGYDLVLEGTDQAWVRYRAAEAAEALKTPLIVAGVHRFDGFVTCLKPYLDDAKGKPLPSFSDFFPKSGSQEALPTCAEIGVLGALTGVIGTMMAMEATKELVGLGESLAGNLLLYDALHSRFTKLSTRAKARAE